MERNPDRYAQYQTWDGPMHFIWCIWYWCVNSPSVAVSPDLSNDIFSCCFIGDWIQQLKLSLTCWGRAMHICVGKLTIFGSDNGLLPGRCQAIICTNDKVLLITPLGTNFSEILIGNQIFSFEEMHLKMSSVKWHALCLGLNVVTRWGRVTHTYRHLFR